MMDDAEPHGELTVRTSAMPADTNANGDIFGGWVMSQMDLAGGIAGVERAQSRVVTAAVDAMHFIRPVRVGDVLCVYTRVGRVGRTSVAIEVEAWARRFQTRIREKVTVMDLKARARRVATNDEIAQVGTISANGDAAVGQMIAQAMQKVGNESVITGAAKAACAAAGRGSSSSSSSAKRPSRRSASSKA